MCGRYTNKLTWAEIVALYRLALPAPPHNMPPRFDICPTGPIDVVTEQDGKRDYVLMRWGLIPRWWSKSLKEAKIATFNARAETIETKPFFRDAFKPALPDPGIWLLRVAEHAGRQAALVFHRPRRLAADICRTMG